MHISKICRDYAYTNYVTNPSRLHLKDINLCILARSCDGTYPLVPMKHSSSSEVYPWLVHTSERVVIVVARGLRADQRPEVEASGAEVSWFLSGLAKGGLTAATRGVSKNAAVLPKTKSCWDEARW